MTMKIRFVLVLLAAVAESCCIDFDGSEYGLTKIINGCEWINRQNVISEILLDRYRKYVTNQFFLMEDVCAVYERNKNSRDSETYGNEVEEEKVIPDENNRDNVSGERPSSSSSGGTVNSTCTRSARDFFVCIIEQLNDSTLNSLILDNLETTCEPRYSAVAANKRNSKYVSKQKFYSWGGKRNVFYPWGGKRNDGRIHRQPKVVIRNPFHAWGGKRSEDYSPDI
ncbi:leucokinins-like [Toxorhynchites rutilus septentrionalis]|uniref:leucokinins-like n=1 Tax=Toxorhynchites rutilus septentrionalis TaxID=329112 RepID=UPI002478FBB8|nr:leucokinins-like [Toxorhynchites rutilus septentrionalis]